MKTIAILAVLSTFSGASSPAGAQTYKPGDGVTSPVMVKDLKPVYTAGAMRRRVQGVVRANCVVLASGKVGDCTVTQPLDADLDQQAITAMKGWEFKPGTKDGEPVAVEVAIEMSFTLREGPSAYRPGNGVSSPVVVKETKPDYPEDLMRAGVQGTVQLEGVVKVDGSIVEIRVTKGLHERLDQEAVKALGQWLFKPGQKDGKEVPVLVSIEMTFNSR